MEQITKMKAVIASIEKDAEKLVVKNNNAAGVRIRKAMMEVRALATEARKEVINIKNANS